MKRLGSEEGYKGVSLAPGCTKPCRPKQLQADCGRTYFIVARDGTCTQEGCRVALLVQRCFGRSRISLRGCAAGLKDARQVEKSGQRRRSMKGQAEGMI